MTDRPSVPDDLAAAAAAAMPETPRSFEDDGVPSSPPIGALVSAVRASHHRFAFDRDGRPAAVAAVRGALPALEAELLDAILEDVSCELAAWQEALYRLAVACRRMDGDST